MFPCLVSYSAAAAAAEEEEEEEEDRAKTLIFWVPISTTYILSWKSTVTEVGSMNW